jgi:hypothetical protein
MGRIKINVHHGKGGAGLVHPLAVRDVLNALDDLEKEKER